MVGAAVERCGEPGGRGEDARKEADREDAADLEAPKDHVAEAVQRNRDERAGETLGEQWIARDAVEGRLEQDRRGHPPRPPDHAVLVERRVQGAVESSGSECHPDALAVADPESIRGVDDRSGQPGDADDAAERENGVAKNPVRAASER